MLIKNQPVDKISAREICLYLVNDSQLYFSQGKPILDNLSKRKVAGTYDKEKAVKLWSYWVESGVKKYSKEFGTIRMNGATKLYCARLVQSEMASGLEYATKELKALKAAKAKKPTTLRR